jgi:predicted CXXCH cytochrome family protein
MILGLLVLMAALRAGADGQGPAFSGIRVRDFAQASAPNLHMPTDVAVGADGRVYVADGVNDRVAVFQPNGDVIGTLSTFGDDMLRRPLSVALDDQGRLFVGDTGNRRIVVFDPDGNFHRAIAAPPSSDAHATDITGLTVAPDGRTLWVVDNDHDRLLRLDLETETWREYGESGRSIGQFWYPFFVSSTPHGELLITDVLNARVQLFNGRGVPVGKVGTYGVRAGQLYRPKGVAVDSVGLVWVSDSVLGVVQVFSQSGDFKGILRDDDGALLRFAEPMGLAFDADDALYVVEFGADRVAKVAVSRNAAAAPVITPSERGGGDRRQAKSCTVCHLAWMPDFETAKTEALIPWPDDSVADPAVARGETCRSCHDGSVVDSRRRVWQDHGHRTNVEPPEGMTVPSNLPLIDGKLACRTCHSAHGASGDMSDLKRAIILRMPNAASELCKSCHADKLGGPRFGTHPTGGMPWAVPTQLVEAGARVGPNPRELTCQVCHTPHGASHDHLLVMGATTNQLCLTCHDQMRPGMFREGDHSEHPLNPLANEEQRAAVVALGTKLSDEGRLICLSCHKLHHGRGERFLLADDLSEGQMCIRCHSQRATMIGSAHDLRTNRPDEVNRLGMTPMSGGPCSACHLFHRYARELIPTQQDVAGQCASCHSAGQCAEDLSLGDINHPTQACLSCHNPHEMRSGHFLARDNVCIECHEDESALGGGPHDNAVWPAGAFDQPAVFSNACLACHRPHGDQDTGLWRRAPADLADADAVCVACHEQAGWDSPHGMAALHPTHANEVALTSGLPMVAAAGDRDGSKRLGCRTCHDPHADPMGAAHLLRAPRDAGEELCLQCHANMRQITRTPHGPGNLRDRGLTGDACGPCHVLHGTRGVAEQDHLFSSTLLASTTAAAGHAKTDDGMPVTDPLCVGCHRVDGVAVSPQVAAHPDVAMFDPSGALPLVSGELGGAADTLGCRTCHLPHGRPPASASVAATTRDERLLLRDFDTPNACTACHGPESLARFLYFHDPRKRAAWE